MLSKTHGAMERKEDVNDIEAMGMRYHVAE